MVKLNDGGPVVGIGNCPRYIRLDLVPVSLGSTPQQNEFLDWAAEPCFCVASHRIVAIAGMEKPAVTVVRSPHSCGYDDDQAAKEITRTWFSMHQ